MTRDPSLPPEPLPLTEASVQEIQLELIRRHQFNEFDGRTVVASLRHHRSLWNAAFMDVLGYPLKEGFHTFGLIKLRDMPTNTWHADTLFVLSPNVADARALTDIAEQEEWKADEVQIVENREELVWALGTSNPKGAIISFWWD